MRGGAEKVQEAGGSLSGGHSIADDSVKYGLSVTGTVHPDRIWQNNTGRVGDLLILTKPLGTGILCAAHRVGEENPGGFQKAVESMMTLNKYASETARKYNIHACTDVTGFSFLGHLHEICREGSCPLQGSRGVGAAYMRPGRFPQASVYHTLPGRACPAPTVQLKQKRTSALSRADVPFYCLKASLFTFFSKKVNQPGCLPM